MTGEPFVSVVVPTHNRASLLPRLLASLAAQDYPAYEVIVVDDASRDATPRLLRDWAGENRRVLRLEVPSGSYAARNEGWRAARGPIVAFTDDDCLPQPGWLRAVTQAMPDAAVGVQGVTLARPGEITPFTHQIEQTVPGPPYRTCNIAYRRETLERLGGFDSGLRWYADNILGYRAAHSGEIAFAPDAVVFHPPRPREWRDRATWLLRFKADAAHRRVLHRLGVEPLTAPGRIWPVLLWIVRPLVQQSTAHLRYLLRHPHDYRRQIGPMIDEKRAMLLAMMDYWLEPWRWKPAPPAKEPLPPLSDEPLVSVVIVTRDRPQSLRLTLEALARQMYPRREVIVVDSPGMGTTRGIARDFAATYVPSVHRGTLAGARQAGVEAAQGEIVAFTDDDCLPAPDWIERLVRAFSRNPELWGVQGRTDAEPGPIGSHAVRVPGPNRLYETCNMAYRRKGITRAGGFDMRFGGYFEDTTLAARILSHGPIGFAPDASVVHRAMPRRQRDAAAWRVLLRDERLFAREYQSFYFRTRGPGFLFTVVARWLIGSPIKLLLRDLPAGLRDPAAYGRLIVSLVRERLVLMKTLKDTARHPDPAVRRAV